VESPLSVKILEGGYKKGEHVLVDCEDGELIFSKMGEKSETPRADPQDEEGETELAVS
jgi:hypothetical protein